ncbi:MAG: hypothetical protein COV08_03495 [Candidatus Vogelbacteria bacterium CG10_big_fil_rev_8_21_14_0_10_49_38]|uniref:Uncharacterized protein n=1 Tax=Candidatus Vogelbacteria bacterium CG10_big_fil_rev_8_21_14_0_10_49_38 TaxID=1975043 RepID=A0A2H0RIU6_9BACT|nr:MAG: hypothetical protein BK006_03485 [bacterium CG10_49_38]PIR45705.1 MAG: hypothetical protein COV08_03495 [Candidatus Vogelbacteria bacterium CG10_big_fil_rev_8_21_14_0_10_49_38]
MFYGFVIIALAWFWQWYRLRGSRRSLDPWFVRLSAVGFFVVVLDTFHLDQWQTWVNSLTLLLVLATIWRLR